jgi:16S rRNA (guanine527-N7)-methyltransferase
MHKGMLPAGEAGEKLQRYVDAIAAAPFNLTGYKTREAMLEGLIGDSYAAMADLHVPRGTRFLDIGTGSGVPGVVIAAAYPDCTGVLLDANAKKIDFISCQTAELGIANVTAVCARAEEYCGAAEVRESFDFCVTKAFGPLYYSLEFSSPALKVGGFLYIYSAIAQEDLHPELAAFADTLGYDAATVAERQKRGLPARGLAWEKKRSTPASYPRRFPVIKREASRIPETIS